MRLFDSRPRWRNENPSSPHIMENKEGNKLLSEIRRNSEILVKTPLLIDRSFLEIMNFNKRTVFS